MIFPCNTVVRFFCYRQIFVVNAFVYQCIFGAVTFQMTLKPKFFFGAFFGYKSVWKMQGFSLLYNRLTFYSVYRHYFKKYLSYSCFFYEL